MDEVGNKRHHLREVAKYSHCTMLYQMFLDLITAICATFDLSKTVGKCSHCFLDLITAICATFDFSKTDGREVFKNEICKLLSRQRWCTLALLILMKQINFVDGIIKPYVVSVIFCSSPLLKLGLIGSMSPWVLPERTLGTVRYTETYPGNYLICRTVPSLLQTVPSFQPPHSRSSRYLQKIARISVYRLKFLLGFTVSYSNPTL